MNILKKSMFYFLVTMFIAGGVYAGNLPAGQVVRVGDATYRVSDDGKQLYITTSSSKAFVDYTEGFNICPSCTVTVTQPDSGSIFVHRDISGDPSVILGNMTGNGQNWVLNSNGVMFGSNAHVDMHGFMATTLNLEPDQFAAGQYTFSSQAGSNPSAVINQGTINSSGVNGYVLLAAPLVVNSGTINATAGSAIIAGASQGTLSFDGAGLINFVVPAATGHAGTVVIPAGQVSDIVKQVVSDPDIVEASGIVEENGQIKLVGEEAINTGTIAAPKEDVSAGAPTNFGSFVLTNGMLEIKEDSLTLNSGTLTFGTTNTYTGSTTINNSFVTENVLLLGQPQTLIISASDQTLTNWNSSLISPIETINITQPSSGWLTVSNNSGVVSTGTLQLSGNANGVVFGQLTPVPQNNSSSSQGAVTINSGGSVTIVGVADDSLLITTSDQSVVNVSPLSISSSQNITIAPPTSNGFSGGTIPVDVNLTARGQLNLGNNSNPVVFPLDRPVLPAKLKTVDIPSISPIVQQPHLINRQDMGNFSPKSNAGALFYTQIDPDFYNSL